MSSFFTAYQYQHSWVDLLFWFPDPRIWQLFPWDRGKLLLTWNQPTSRWESQRYPTPCNRAVYLWWMVFKPDHRGAIIHLDCVEGYDVYEVESLFK